jgi:hypothetical protein
MESPNGRHMPIAPAPTREEAAAIVAAVERFRRSTAAPALPAVAAAERWRSAALAEGVARWPGSEIRDPWINT